MAVYTYNDVQYDINENIDLINALKTVQSIAPRTGLKGIVSKDFGYGSVGLYCVDILSGISRAVEDYNYNSLIVLKVKETYIDSENKKHYVNKLINLGGYIVEKGKSVKIKHLSNMYCGKLQSVEFTLMNYSEFTIKVKNLSLYKSVDYVGSESGDGATYIEVRNGLPPESEIKAGRIFYDLSGGVV